MPNKIYSNVEILSTPTDEKHIAKLENIKINKIKVNGIDQTIKNKEVDIFVPTKTSQLTNDSGFSSNKDVTFSLAQFDTYTDLLNQMKIYSTMYTITEGTYVIVKKGEIISTTDASGNAINTEYPYGLYKYNSATDLWEFQDHLTREEFQNHAEDTNKHVSTSDRYSWDNKADGVFEITDIDITSSLFQGNSKNIIDSAYLYTQLINMKSVLDAQYETISDFNEHENNMHTDIIHVTATEKSELHTHSNQTNILDNLGEDASGNLTFNGLSVVGGTNKATKTNLGQVIIGDGIEVKTDGTIYIDWYNAVDNGNGTSSITIGSVKYTKDNTTGEIKGSSVSGVDIGETTTTDSLGNVIKVENVGGTTTTTTTATDGSVTIISDNNGTITTTKNDTSGNIISIVVGDTVVSGSVTDTSSTTSTDATTGITTQKTVTTVTTIDGQTETTETIIIQPTGETTETTSTVHSSGNNVNFGIATGESTTVEKDATGNIISNTTEKILNKDGANNLITQSDLNYLFTSIDNLW